MMILNSAKNGDKNDIKKDDKKDIKKDIKKRVYTDKQKFNHLCRLLGSTNAKIKKQFKYDDVAIDSITHFDIADDISKSIMKCADSIFADKQKYSILDAFACVGGNTISFCLSGFDVSAIELNDERFEMLKYNTKLFNCSPALYNDNAIEFLIKKNIGKADIPEFDIIFIDVPWDNRVDGILYVGSLRLREIVRLCGMKIIVLKLPIDYDIGMEFGDIMGSISAEIYEEPSKMLIITIIQ